MHSNLIFLSVLAVHVDDQEINEINQCLHIERIAGNIVISRSGKLRARAWACRQENNSSIVAIWQANVDGRGKIFRKSPVEGYRNDIPSKDNLLRFDPAA